MKKFRKILFIALPVFLVLTAVSAYLLFLGDSATKLIYSNTENFGPFDVRFSYTPDNIMTILSHYKGERSEDYTRYFTYDFIFAGCSFFFMLLTPLLINTFSSKHYLFFRASVFSSVFSAFFNILENILLMRIISSFPAFTDSDANLASGCTMLKWIFIGIWIFSTVLFVGLTTLTVIKQKRSD